ncbi:hypothetical protein J2X69_000315 [Algoriphagus sp. 4150]|nr:hypothetical protein [Algoriphagus sp. 4150]
MWDRQAFTRYGLLIHEKKTLHTTRAYVHNNWARICNDPYLQSEFWVTLQNGVLSEHL